MAESQGFAAYTQSEPNIYVGLKANFQEDMPGTNFTPRLEHPSPLSNRIWRNVATA
jgi:hypothetical protein